MDMNLRGKRWKPVHRCGVRKAALAVLGLLAVLSAAGCGRLQDDFGDHKSIGSGRSTENIENMGNTENTENSAESLTGISPEFEVKESSEAEAAVKPSVSDEMILESVTPETEPVTSEADLIAEEVEKLLADMTLEEKIYQMFIVTPEQLTGVSTVTAAGDATKASLARYPVGGLVYFAGNLVSPDQTKTMLSNMQSYADEIEGVDLFLCVDEEGGRVARVAKNGAFQAENMPPMADVSSVEEAYRCGDTIGAYLSELGFNVDFAPDADVLTNGANTVIGDRSFGSDPEIVTKYAIAYSDGLHAHGMMSTFKHFPGHGATEADTHEGYAYTDKSYEALMESELKPFCAAGANGVDLVMVAHISVPTVTGDNTPSSLSEKMIAGILRGELEYDGLIVTDALNMGAIAGNYSSSSTAVKAVTAGADLLLMPGDLQAAYSGIYNAVRSGEISEERIDESVRRILTAKVRLSR